MLDRCYLSIPFDTGTRQESHTHVHHEHRAPTDESVKILKELEAAAESRVLERVDLRNNVKGSIIRMQSLDMFEHRIVMVFELNGVKYKTDPVCVEPAYVMDKTEWVTKLMDLMGRATALELINLNPTSTWMAK